MAHWCKDYKPKPNSNGNCGDCHNYNAIKGYCPIRGEPTAIVHAPVRARGRRSSRVTGILR